MLQATLPKSGNSVSNIHKHIRAAELIFTLPESGDKIQTQTHFIWPYELYIDVIEMFGQETSIKAIFAAGMDATFRI